MKRKQDSRQAAHDRKHGNAGWAPCLKCAAYGVFGKEKCPACDGIGFIRRDSMNEGK